MIIIFVGPPGSGKGTQAQELAQKFNVIHISTGELLRKEINAVSTLGQRIQKNINNGELVPDDDILELIRDIVLKNINKNIIFDGFPRTLKQAIALDNLLGVKKLDIDIVFNFDIDTCVLIERISGRYTCLGCGAVYHCINKKPKTEGICDSCHKSYFDIRKDDTVSALEKRIKIYNQETALYKDYYAKKGILKQVNASLLPSHVTHIITTTLIQAGLTLKRK